MMDDRNDGRTLDAAAHGTPNAKRAYKAPVLTEYGSLEALVDSGVVHSGNVPSILLVPLLGR